MTHAPALQRFTWRHPEATVALVAAWAWMLLLLTLIGGQAAHSRAHDTAPLVAGAWGWLLMSVAMMVPTALPAARRLGLNSLWHRRQRTMSLFLVAYLGVWAAFGAVAVPAVAMPEHLTPIDTTTMLAAVLALAAAWELTPWKWQNVRACHLVAPVPPSGRKADVACLAGGVRYGFRCVAACWPAMLAMAVAGHTSLGLMALLAALIATEKLSLRPGRLAGPGAAVLAGASIGVVLL